MPNWCEGNIRFRGAVKNIKKFLKQELVACKYGDNFEVIMDKPVIIDDGFSLIITKPDSSWFYINNTHRNFFNDDIEIVDIMTMALATICDTNKYVRWCQLTDHVTAKGNVQTNAETVYAYLTRNSEYVEAHHALQDCEIEADIYFKARKYRKKHHKQFAMPVFHCEEWRKVQARR